MMRVAFFIPPFFRLMGSHNNKVGPSILATALVLTECWHDARIFNADAITDSEVYANWFSIAKNYQHYKDYIVRLSQGYSDLPGLWDTISAMAEYEPECIFICCGDPAIPTVDIGGIEVAFYSIPILKIAFPKARIFGYGYAFSSNECLAAEVHAVLPSLGELGVIEFLAKRLNTPIEPRRRNLDDVPHFSAQRHLGEITERFTARDLVVPSVPISAFDYTMSSRGCAWAKCLFCPHSSGEAKCTSATPYWFCTEVATKFYAGLDYQYFADMDFLSHSISWLDIFASCRSNHLHEKTLSFSIESRASSVHMKKLGILKAAGLTTVKLGVEAATDKLLLLYGKGLNLAQIKTSVKKIRAFDLKLVVYLLLGHPGATVDDYKESLQNAAALQADYYVVNLACPYKGTKLYDLVQDDLMQAGLIHNGIEHGFTHLSDDLRNFWGVPEELFDQYLQLSRSTTKEDHGIGPKQYVERIL